MLHDLLPHSLRPSSSVTLLVGLHPPAGERSYELEHLPTLLGVSSAEVQAFLAERGLPATGAEGTVRESELARWVGMQNRYQLLPVGLSWTAPTPRHLPDLGWQSPG